MPLSRKKKLRVFKKEYQRDTLKTEVVRHYLAPYGLTTVEVKGAPLSIIEHRIKHPNIQGNFHHRVGGPAIEYDNGAFVYAFCGYIHRDESEGPAIINHHRDSVYINMGKIHRESGPAVIKEDGAMEWWKNGKRHREDGPAVIKEDGEEEYYFYGQHLSKKQWETL